MDTWNNYTIYGEYCLVSFGLLTEGKKRDGQLFDSHYY